MSKNILVGQSGGPTAVINGSLYGVITKGFEMPQIDHVYGMVNGIEGFLHGQMMDMQTLIKDGTLPLVKTTPGAYLGSCRYKLPEDLADPVYPELFTDLKSTKSRPSFISEVMTLWTQSASSPATPRSMKARSALSESQRPSIMTW